MPRHARKRSESGIYHVVVRGINRQDIFHDDEDFQRYIETIDKIKQEDSLELYGYCLMNNHIHLLLSEKKDDIAKIMKRIGTSYAWWYNWKYDRIGHVFQDRFKSESVEDEGYLLTVIRYIHNNPVKANIENSPEDYKWSSCSAYYTGNEYPVNMTKTEYILGIISNDIKLARKKFKEHMKSYCEIKCLEYELKCKKNDEELKKEIEEIIMRKSITSLMSRNKEIRDDLIRQIKGINGVTQRQIARVLGINVNTIFRA